MRSALLGFLRFVPEAASGGPDRDLRAAAEAETVQDRGDMVGHRARLEGQLLGDLHIAEALPDQPCHVTLTGRQLRVARA